MSDSKADQARALANKILGVIPDGIHSTTVISALLTVLVSGTVPDYSRDELHRYLDASYDLALQKLAFLARGH